MAGYGEPAVVRAAEDGIRSIFQIDDEFDVVLMQAEAIALLEASSKALAAPSGTAAAVLTSVYGEDFALWFESNGATATRIDVLRERRSVTPDEIRDAAGDHLDVLAIVQGEALTGMVNDVAGAVSALPTGTRVIVDAVSSIGAEPLVPSRWGECIAIAGFQKATAGPAGVSAAVVHRSLWETMEANPAAPRHSFLSLLDLKRTWLDDGRRELPAAPNSEELRALTEMIDGLQRTGIDSVESRHQHAAAQARAAVDAVPELRRRVPDRQASGIATVFELPSEVDRGALLRALAQAEVHEIKPAPGAQELRWMHYGRDAQADRVERAGTALAAAIGRAS